MSENFRNAPGGIACFEVDEADVCVCLRDEHEHALVGDGVEEHLTVLALYGRFLQFPEFQRRGNTLADAERGGGHCRNPVRIAGRERMADRQAVSRGNQDVTQFGNGRSESRDDVVELSLLVHSLFSFPQKAGLRAKRRETGCSCKNWDYMAWPPVSSASVMLLTRRASTRY